ncbi:SDR family oxidoreductase, partial [Actinomadura adrarensis]
APGVLESAARTAALELDGVDLLVNAAGVLAPSFLADGPVDEWERQISVNVTGLLRLSRAVLPELLKSASAGATTDLVNVSSVAASQPEFGAAVYASTKAAVTHLSRHFRLELAAQNVRVTDVQPGMVETEIRKNSELGTAWEEDMKTRITPLTADDVAELIAFTVTRPPHFNLPEISVLPTRQT